MARVRVFATCRHTIPWELFVYSQGELAPGGAILHSCSSGGGYESHGRVRGKIGKMKKREDGWRWGGGVRGLDSV